MFHIFGAVIDSVDSEFNLSFFICFKLEIYIYIYELSFTFFIYVFSSGTTANLEAFRKSDRKYKISIDLLSLPYFDSSIILIFSSVLYNWNSKNYTASSFALFLCIPKSME